MYYEFDVITGTQIIGEDVSTLRHAIREDHVAMIVRDGEKTMMILSSHTGKATPVMVNEKYENVVCRLNSEQIAPEDYLSEEDQVKRFREAMNFEDLLGDEEAEEDPSS